MRDYGFGTFLREFWPNVGALMSGAASVPLAFSAIYLANPPLKVLFACLAVFSVVGACYQVWRDSMRDLQGTIAERDAEIEKLKHRPYDEAHRQLADSKLNAISEASKDAVYFLLHHGKTEAEEFRKKCKHDPEFFPAIERARDAGLLLHIVGEQYRSTGTHFWEVKPAFNVVLQDLLGKRQTTYF